MHCNMSRKDYETVLGLGTTVQPIFKIFFLKLQNKIYKLRFLKLIKQKTYHHIAVCKKSLWHGTVHKCCGRLKTGTKN